jgi:tetratricopeptide (TPR) repeat protein
MFQFLRAVSRGITYPLRAARQRPRVALALAALALVGATAAGIGYERYQWHAAQSALAADRPGEAVNRLTVCLFVWPSDPDVHLLAARAARLNGDLRAAEAHLNRCQKLHGEATQAVQLEFLLLRVQAGDVEEAAPTLIDSVEKGHPDSPAILETLGRAYMLRLRYKAAYACVSRWIELQPDLVKPYQWRGWVLERLNQPRAAKEDYLRALELDPDLIPVRLRLAEMLLEDKRTPEALPHLERLNQQAPGHPQVQGLLGICRFFQNRPEEARQLMEAAVVHLPKDPSLLIHLAKLDLQQGRGADAEKLLLRVLKLDKSDTEALYNLASALQLQGRTKEAAATLKEYQHYRDWVDRANKLLREVADSPTATAADYAEIGRLLLHIGRDRLGVYWMERALDLDPGHRPAHAALAEHYEKIGDPERAAAHRRWLGPGEKVDGSKK